ncbi:helix-turn-helix protein [Tibeticola sediminis]|uniref:Helix-turn-helix protein n=1 Tax=Tibeticola sediminis TaxID=1917811 RepID=A0A3N4VF57_9BURK|nr:helix-turn-helix domain-containing protein [Tibeticola sediminis]RPE72510.1 helix-turn-helix protein [Tibeticola sediminis]
MKCDADIADRIKAWRHALGLTQDEFSRRSGISKATLVGYEVGQRKPGSDALAAIARTGVDMRWLLTGEGEMLPKPAPDKDFSDVPYARRLEKIGLLLAGLTEQEAAAFLDEMFARAHDAARRHELEQALIQMRAELDRLKKTA